MYKGITFSASLMCIDWINVGKQLVDLEENNIDYIVYGEGEITMNELCNAIDSKKTDMSDIRGLIYRNGDQISINLPRELIPDLDEMPFPARELVNYDTYLQPPGLIRGVWTERSANLSTSRGCPGRCTYCGVNYLCWRRHWYG